MLQLLFEGKEKIDRFGEVSSDLSPAFRTFGEYRSRRLIDHIQAGQDPYGDNYTPLTDTYLKRKRASVGDKPILEYSGGTIQTHAIFYNNVSGRYSESIEGNARFHQEGLGSNPIRLYLPTEERGLPDQDRSVLETLIRKQVERKANSIERKVVQSTRQIASWLRRFI